LARTAGTVCDKEKKQGCDLADRHQSQVKGIFAQMDVINRTEVVANATRRGLIQLSFLHFS
jgi:hypothetical protein